MNRYVTYCRECLHPIYAGEWYDIIRATGMILCQKCKNDVIAKKPTDAEIFRVHKATGDPKLDFPKLDFFWLDF